MALEAYSFTAQSKRKTVQRKDLGKELGLSKSMDQSYNGIQCALIIMSHLEPEMYDLIKRVIFI